MRFLKKYIYFILSIIFIFASTVNPAQAEAPPNFANCRLGVCGVKGDVVGYDLDQLNMGLYLDWITRSSPPAGLSGDIEYIQMVRVHQDKGDYGSDWFGPPRVYLDPPAYLVKPSLAQIASRAASLPGSLWLIGNEIERVDWKGSGEYRGMDEITPELYATAFHEIREVIKTADPTARIAIGGMIEPTPLRLEYLNRVWNSYFNQYGYSMGNDIDVWNVHAYILREVKSGWNGRSGWGADIPAGLDENVGFLSEFDETTPEGLQALYDAHHDMDIFRSFIEDFRTWMAAHDERNKPLIISEHSTLLDVDLGDPTYPKARKHLTDTFSYMLTTTDDTIGYPADENRLVQGWTWYSLNDDIQYTHSTLFNSTTKDLTIVGDEWRNYVSDLGNPLASQAQRNLLVTNLRADPNPASVSPGETVTPTLKVDVANSGNTETVTGNNIVVKFWDGVPNEPGSNLIASQTVDDIPGCGRFITVETDWPNRPAGEHLWYVEVVPIAGETKTNDNIANSVLSIIEGTPQADLAVTKTVNEDKPYTGSTIDYTITATNIGPHTVTAVEVNDLLPTGLTFDSYIATQGNYYTNGVWEVGTLDSDSGAILTITAKVNAGQGGITITNQASITNTYHFSDTNLDNNNTPPVDIVPVESHKTYLPVVLK